MNSGCVKPLSVALHLAAQLVDHGTNNGMGLIPKEHIYWLNEHTECT